MLPDAVSIILVPLIILLMLIHLILLPQPFILLLNLILLVILILLILLHLPCLFPALPVSHAVGSGCLSAQGARQGRTGEWRPRLERMG